MGRLFPEDPDGKFKLGIILLIFVGLDGLSVLANLQPIFISQAFFVFEVPLGVVLVTWSRIQQNRESRVDFQEPLTQN